MDNTSTFMEDWRLHLVVVAIVIITELIGTHEIAVGAGAILLRRCYMQFLGLAAFFTPLINKKQSKKQRHWSLCLSHF